MDGDIRTLDREAFRLGIAVDELEALYLQTGGEVTAETEALERFIESSGPSTVEALCSYLSEIEARREYGKREAARLVALQERLDKREKWCERLIRGTLDKLEVRKLDVGTWSVSVVAGRPMALPVEGSGTTPEEYEVTTIQNRPDKRKILDALNAGKEVPGWMLGRSAESLRIK